MNRKSLEAGLIFTVLITVAVIYFEVRAGFLVRKEYFALAAYMPAIIGALLFGARFSRWYQPVEGKKHYMELILVPIAVVFSSVMGASLAFSLVAILMDGASLNFIGQYILSAIFPAIVFISVTWPILLVGGMASSLYIGWRNKCF